jgi:hypothetical protein
MSGGIQNHLSVVGLYTTIAEVQFLRMLTWDRTGPLEESGELSVGKGGESVVESRHLQRCSPRLCRLRTEWLVPVSKYWMYWSYAKDMGPVNRYSLSSTDAWFCLDCFNGREEERNWVGIHRSVSRRTGDVVRSPFLSGAVDPFNAVDD